MARVVPHIRRPTYGYISVLNARICLLHISSSFLYFIRRRGEKAKRRATRSAQINSQMLINLPSMELEIVFHFTRGATFFHVHVRHRSTLVFRSVLIFFLLFTFLADFTLRSANWLMAQSTLYNTRSNSLIGLENQGKKWVFSFLFVSFLFLFLFLLFALASTIGTFVRGRESKCPIYPHL